MRGEVQGDGAGWNAAYRWDWHWNLQYNMGEQENSSSTPWRGTGGLGDEINKLPLTVRFGPWIKLLNKRNSRFIRFPQPTRRVRGTMFEERDANRSLIKFLIIRLTQQLVIGGNEAWRGFSIKTCDVKLYEQCRLKCDFVGVSAPLIRTGIKYTSH